MSVVTFMVISACGVAFAYFSALYALRASARTEAQRALALLQARWTAVFAAIVFLALGFFVLPGSEP